MLTDRQKEIFNLLREWLEEEFGKTEMIEQEDVTFLRVLPPLFVEGEERVITDICLYEYMDEITVAQIYTTIALEIESAADALRARLPEWNFVSLAGSYGIYDKLGQLYHKQNIALIHDAAVDDQVDFLFSGFCLALDEIAQHYPEILTIVRGETV